MAPRSGPVLETYQKKTKQKIKDVFSSVWSQDYWFSLPVSTASMLEFPGFPREKEEAWCVGLRSVIFPCRWRLRRRNRRRQKPLVSRGF